MILIYFHTIPSHKAEYKSDNGKRKQDMHNMVGVPIKETNRPG